MMIPKEYQVNHDTPTREQLFDDLLKELLLLPIDSPFHLHKADSLIFRLSLHLLFTSHNAQHRKQLIGAIARSIEQVETKLGKNPPPLQVVHWRFLSFLLNCRNQLLEHVMSGELLHPEHRAQIHYLLDSEYGGDPQRSEKSTCKSCRFHVHPEHLDEHGRCPMCRATPYGEEPSSQTP